MHAEHADELLIGSRIGAEPHESEGHRKAGCLDQFSEAHAGFTAGVHQAATHIEDRLLRFRHQIDSALDLGLKRLGSRFVALWPNQIFRDIRCLAHLHILGQVDNNGAGAAGPGHVERLMDRPGQRIARLHQVVVFGAGARDPDRIRFLKGIIADHMGRHLAGQADQRHAVHQRIGQPGHCIGRPGAGCHQHDAGLAG